MERHTLEQMAEVQRLHQLWLSGDQTGRRADLCGANLCGANLRGADLRGADLSDANLRGADLCSADLSDANLRGANLNDANLRDANLRGAGKISTLMVFGGLYQYQCWAVVTVEGAPWVRMGCLFKSVDEWNTIGIRQSNTGEFPNDASEKCERRVRTFEFVKTEALLLAEKFKPAPTS